MAWLAKVAAGVLGARCAGCGSRLPIATAQLWCALCEATIEVAHAGKPTLDPMVGLPVVCAWRYGGAVRDAIVATKLRGARGAGPLVEAAVRCVSGGPLDFSAAMLVPVPPQPERLRQRLGHLPDRLAAGLAVVSPTAVSTWALERRDRAPMRRDNGAIGPDFRVTRAGGGRPAMVVDDVVTTGLTLATAAAALKQANWQVVGAICLADARRGWAEDAELMQSARAATVPLAR
jgi:predicted amidophosphoribosyltransferase